jgi:hypothetical protein
MKGTEMQELAKHLWEEVQKITTGVTFDPTPKAPEDLRHPVHFQLNGIRAGYAEASESKRASALQEAMGYVKEAFEHTSAGAVAYPMKDVITAGVVSLYEEDEDLTFAILIEDKNFNPRNPEWWEYLIARAVQAEIGFGYPVYENFIPVTDWKQSITYYGELLNGLVFKWKARGTRVNVKIEEKGVRVFFCTKESTN